MCIYQPRYIKVKCTSLCKTAKKGWWKRTGGGGWGVGREGFLGSLASLEGKLAIC